MAAVTLRGKKGIDSMAAASMNPKVDAYIDKAQPFAQPILEHLRKLMHKGCPDVEEAIKWSMPFFVYKGAILANMAAFKAHCAFGFWGKEMTAVLHEAKVASGDAMGTLGRISSVKDLPPEKLMLGWIRQAAGSIDDGTYVSPIAARNKVMKAPRAQSAIAPEFAAALKKNKKAAAVFEAFSPSCKREYVDWIAEAKREETRDKRIAQAVEWIAEGKQRNWKYQNC
jgi:uncharacterized protein YdeI (YjbR/CyaY-like superfamily)